MTRPLNIGIIGCGTAGASAALFLARAGHRITVYEAVSEPHAVGAGITLQPTGMAVLSRLGLLEPVVARGARIDHLYCVTRRGRPVLDMRYSDFDESTFGLGLHRGVLFETLFRAVQEEPGVELRLSMPIAGLRARAKRRVVVDRAGRDVGEHDLVIVADGARSQLRDDVNLALRQSMYPWGALWFIGDDPEGEFDGALHQVVEGTERMFGMLPSGLGPAVEGQADTKKVSLFWSVRADRVDAWHEAGLDAWTSLLGEMEPRSRDLLEQIHEPEQVLFARYFDVVMRRWHQPGVVFLGDAAHATSPQLGQGANLALMDAMALHDALQNQPTLDDALRTYSSMRASHLRYYQWATRFLTPFFQSDMKPLGWLRDALGATACRIPFVRKKMVRTMCGLERGIVFSNPMRLDRASPGV